VSYVFKLWKDGRASSNNVLGQSDSCPGVIHLSKELGGNGTQRLQTATDSMHIDLGCSARRSESSAPCSDLTSTLGHLCARLEVEAKRNSSDRSVDSTVYQARKINARVCSGRVRAGEQ
jgi:hypothetical protein